MKKIGLNFLESQEPFQVYLGVLKFWRIVDSTNNMGCIPAYSQKDKAVLNKIKKESLRRDDCLHEADEKILFDVHEYLKNNPNADLLFVSGDKRFVKAISILIDVLAFNRVIYLEDFLKN